MATSTWEVFREAGWAAWLVVFVAMMASSLAPVAFVLSFFEKTRRASLFVAFGALAMTALVAGIGWFGFVRAQHTVEGIVVSSVAAQTIGWDSAVSLAVQGFRECRSILKVTFFGALLPFLGGAFSLVIAYVRQPDRDPNAVKIDRAISVSISLFSALCLAVLLSSGWRDASAAASELARDSLTRDLQSRLSKPLNVPTCRQLEDAYGEMGALETQRRVSTASKVAHDCIELYLSTLPANTPADVTPPSLLPPSQGAVTADEVYRQRLRALLEGSSNVPESPSSSPRLDALEKIKASRLLLEPEQQKKVDELIQEAKKPIEQPGNPSGMWGLLGNPGDPVPPGALGYFSPPSGSATIVAPGIRAKLTSGPLTVTGRLPPEIIQRILRLNIHRLKMCAEQSLATNPKLQGEIKQRFVISKDGSVAMVGDSGSASELAAVARCFSTVLRTLSFPAPEGGIVVVVTGWTMRAAE